MRRALRSDDLALALFLILAVTGLVLWVYRVNAATPLIFDELLYLWQARLLATGHLTAATPVHHEFVSVLHLFDLDGRCFGQYPIGYPLALIPWVVAGIPWGLNVFLGGASLLLLYRFASRLDGRATAWVAMLLTALSPFFVVQSTTFLVHPLTLALTLLLALLRRERSSRRAGWAGLAGATIGYAGNISPFLVVPMLAVSADRWLSTRRTRPVDRRQLIAFTMPLLAGVALFCAVNYGTTGSPWRPAYFLQSWVRPGFGETVDKSGYTPIEALINTEDRLANLNRMLFGWPFSSFLFAGPYLAIAFARHLARRGEPRAEPIPSERGPLGSDRWTRTLIVLFAGTVGIYAFWYFPGTRDGLGPRYFYATLPALSLFSARGVVALGRILRLAARGRGHADLLGRTVPSLLLAALTVTGTIPMFARMAETGPPRGRREVRAFLDDLEQRGIRRGTVFVTEGSVRKYQRSALLYWSDFSDSKDLVFALDLGPRKNAEFVKDRGGGPVYYVTLTNENRSWRLSDAPAGESQAPETSLAR